MLRIVMFAIALTATPAAASKLDGSCSQVFEVATAGIRWALARPSSVDPAHDEESCRAYGRQFFRAVEVRQATSICADGIDRQRALEVLDAAIDAVNNLIASQCGGL